MAAHDIEGASKAAKHERMFTPKLPMNDPVEHAFRILEISKVRSGALGGRREIDVVARRFNLEPGQVATLEMRAEAAGLVQGLEPAQEAQREAARSTEDFDILGALRRDVGRVKLLSQAEEIALGDAIIFGRAAEDALKDDELDSDQRDRLFASVARGKQAFDEFFRRNVPLVMRIATWNQSQGVEYLDLVQFGAIGLMRAVQRWNPHRGYRFSTFAYYWIRQSISRGIADTGRAIRLPVHVVEWLARILRAKEELRRSLERTASVYEIADRVGLPVEKVALFIDLDQSLISLDSPVNDETGGATILDFQMSQEPDPLDAVVLRERNDVLWSRIGLLSKRQQIVLIKRFGLDGLPAMTLEELGECFGVTRERVRQIETKALTHLKLYTSHRLLREVLDP